MKILYNILVSLLLVFNGVGAVIGGWLLITQPDGSALKLSLDLLEHTPFHDFLIPGIILFVVNGLFSLYVLKAFIQDYKSAYRLILAQGILLCGWLLVQIILIRVIHPLHFLLLGMGIALIVLGIMCRNCNSLNK